MARLASNERQSYSSGYSSGGGYGSGYSGGYSTYTVTRRRKKLELAWMLGWRGAVFGAAAGAAIGSMCVGLNKGIGWTVGNIAASAIGGAFVCVCHGLFERRKAEKKAPIPALIIVKGIMGGTLGVGVALLGKALPFPWVIDCVTAGASLVAALGVAVGLVKGE